MSGENTAPKFPEATSKEAIFFDHIITSNKGKLEGLFQHFDPSFSQIV
jgi:hypothetical protein